LTVEKNGKERAKNSVSNGKQESFKGGTISQKQKEEHSKRRRKIVTDFLGNEEKYKLNIYIKRSVLGTAAVEKVQTSLNRGRTPR